MADHRFKANNIPTNCEYNVEGRDYYQTALKYLSDILMEEDLEAKACMIQDSLALQSAEKSFYDVLRDTHPCSSSTSYVCCNQNYVLPDCLSTPAGRIESSNFFASNSNFSYSPNRTLRSTGTATTQVDMAPTWQTNVPTTLGQPSEESPCFVDSTLQLLPDYYKDRKRERRNRDREERAHLKDIRKKKVPVVNDEESEQLTRLEHLFLFQVSNGEPSPYPLYDALKNEASKKFQQLEKIGQSSNSRIMKLGNCNDETVDLSSLLTQCAQAVGSGDQSVAKELLKLIRQQSSPFGDGNQRLAHYFANSLEARLSGTENIFCAPSFGSLASAADILKAYQLYVSICPFRKMSNMFANRNIVEVTGTAASLHIIDFGISYGFQWPCLIHRVSTRPGGPPKIRMTGIDLPQPGPRPSERVEETGLRLKRLAERFNVPFEYKAIAQRWDTIRYEDLNIDRNDVIAVNCMFRLRNLPDDTLVINSPRDMVLKLIKQISPEIFIHGVVNGSFNAPFFTTRFREALFHFSALFDILDANTPREDPDRLVFERDMVGKDAMNVLGCEGAARVERPETYKQWQGRNSRIGFRQLQLHQGIMKRIRDVKSDFHKEFIVDTDGDWLLLGWKGRTILALSAWKPVQC